MDEQRPPINTCSVSDIICWCVNPLRLLLSRSTMNVTDRTVVGGDASSGAGRCRTVSELVAIFSSWSLRVGEWVEEIYCPPKRNI